MDSNQIANLLYEQAIRTWDAGIMANTALDALRARVEAKLQNLSGRSGNNDGDDYDPVKWAGVMEGDTPIDNFQVHVCRWNHIGPGRAPARVVYNDDIRKSKDSAGRLRGGKPADRQAYPDTGKLDRYVNDYFYWLFMAPHAPLRHLGDMFDAIDRQYFRHRVVLSLDFYYARPLTQLGLHKDTTGNTLFVGLHYNNEERMLGPEYMYDFWPMTKEEDRYHSPWSQDDGYGDVGYWPKELIAGLQLARDQVALIRGDSQELLRATTLEPNGLVTFVDELIFHQTPLTRKRKKGELGTLLQEVNINGVKYDLKDRMGGEMQRKKGPPRLRRQFSENNMEKNWKGFGTGGGKRRSFVRFWAMVEPRVWHF